MKPNLAIAALITCSLAAGSARGAWEIITKPAMLAKFKEIAVGKGGHLYSRDNGIVWHSADGGKSFEQLTMSISVKGANVAIAKVEYASPITIAASGDLFMGIGVTGLGTMTGSTLGYSVIRSKDHGKTWTSVVRTRDYKARVFAAPNGAVYLAVADSSSAWLQALSVSKDNGDFWERVAKFAVISQVAIDPDNNLYLDGLLPESDPAIHKLYKSTDGGAKWDSLSITNGYSVDFLVANRKGCLMMGVAPAFYVSTPAAPALSARQVEISNSPTAITFTPDLHILQAIGHIGIRDFAPPYNFYYTQNQGLGADTASFEMMQYDENENLYMIAGSNLYMLKGPVTSIRPVHADYRLLHPRGESAWFDPAGRRVFANRFGLFRETVSGGKAR